MPVGLFTNHAYRSWSEGNPRGYVQRGKPGVQPPNVRLAQHRAAIATAPPVRFDRQQMDLLINSAREVCQELGWRLHAAACTPTHVHLVVSWKDSTPQRQVMTLLKRKLGHRLSKHKGTNGNRWFSRGGDEKPVTDRRHFDHLLRKYLPGHMNQHGVFWRETPSTACNAVPGAQRYETNPDNPSTACNAVPTPGVASPCGPGSRLSGRD